MGTFCLPQAEKNDLPGGRYGKRFPFVYHGMGMARQGGKPLCEVGWYVWRPGGGVDGEKQAA